MKGSPLQPTTLRFRRCRGSRTLCELGIVDRQKEYGRVGIHIRHFTRITLWCTWCQQIEQMLRPSPSNTLDTATFLGDLCLVCNWSGLKTLIFYLGMKVSHDTQEFIMTPVRFDARGNVLNWRFELVSLMHWGLGRSPWYDTWGRGRVSWTSTRLGAFVWEGGLITFLCLYLRRSSVLLVGWWSTLILRSFLIFWCILWDEIFIVNVFLCSRRNPIVCFIYLGYILISSTITLFICFIYVQRFCIINLHSFIYGFNCDVKT